MPNKKDPSEIIAELDAVLEGRKIADHMGIVWGIIDDVCDSFSLAMKSYGIEAFTAEEIRATVDDYCINHYGC